MRRLAAALLSALSLAGCSFAAGDAAIVENRCSADSDCPGASCQAGMCVAPPDEPLRVVLQITPITGSNGGSATTHTVGPFDVTDVGTRDVVLDQAISVFGMVSWQGLPDGMSADVRFTRIEPDAELATVPRVVREASTLSTPTDAADGMAANYGVRVLTGRAYEVTISPRGEGAALLPPMRTVVEVPSFSGPADFLRIDFEYPAELTEVRGVIVGPDEVQVPGLQVEAVEVESARVISSTVTTDTAGEFVLHLVPDAPAWVFRIRGDDYPTLLADPSYFFPDSSGFVRILVPTFTRVFVRGTVVPKDLSSGVGVPEALLSFSSTDVYDDTTGVVGSFRTTTMTDATGEYSVQLFPGSYDVTVTPQAEVTLPGYEVPVASELGIVVEQGLELRLPAEGGELVGQSFELPERAQLHGTVVKSDGGLISGALMVQATALGLPGENLADALNRSADTLTDPLGQFSMRLDFGTYDIAVKPPQESGFSWIVLPGMSFASRALVERNHLELAAPTPLTGTITSGDDGAALIGAEVRAFALVDHDGATRAVQIGRATTGPDGSYMLLLPSRL